MPLVSYVVDGSKYVTETRQGFTLVSYAATLPAEKRDLVFNWLLDSGLHFSMIEVRDADAS